MTRLALRDTFCNSIDAPTPEELAKPIDAVPEGASEQAFRSGSGAWS